MLKGASVVVVAAAVVAAGCSSSSHSSSPAAASPTTANAHACDRAATTVAAAHVAGSPTDWDMTSFDGTRIRFHWFPLKTASATSVAPTVLKGPGWGSAGDTNTAGSGYGLFGDLSIHALQAAGYNVLTWDPRGFGKSAGTVEIDSSDVEGRDVSRLIDWIAREPGVQLDTSGDPRVGMVGASYGGGIQLSTAAVDCRVDAIVPQLAWHSLGTSLYGAQTVKQGWGDLLYSVAKGVSLDAHITSAHNSGDATGTLNAEDQKWFLDRGPGDLVNNITAPTLFEQGTIDTLFPLAEAVTNFHALIAKGTPTAMLWMCSGHGVCLTNPGDQNAPGQAAIAWLNRYVKRDASAQLPPLFSYVDQNGMTYHATAFPPPVATPITASGGGTLQLIATGGSGPAHATGNVGAVGSISLAITPAKAANAVNVGLTFANDANLVGAPQLTLDYSGSVSAGARPQRVFAQLVDDTTGIVVDNQITPIDVVLDGKPHTTTVPLEWIAFTAKAHAHLTLQLVATTTAYAPPRLGGSVKFSSIRFQLPTVTGVNRG